MSTLMKKLEFNKIQAEDYKKLKDYFMLRKNKSCDSTFLNYYMWSDLCNTQYAICDRALIWLMNRDGEYFSEMPMCLEADLYNAIDNLKNYYKYQLNRSLIINEADEEAVRYLLPCKDEYIIKELLDNKDYIYDYKELTHLEGRKFHDKKNHINIFLNNYMGRYEYRGLSSKDKDDVSKFLDYWIGIKKECSVELLSEITGIKNVFNNLDKLNVKVAGVYIDDILQAFTIGEYNKLERMAIIHVEKANPYINGLYQFINQKFLESEFKEALIVNREDDVGVEGIRRAKLSYNPIYFERKYRLELINNI